MSIDKSLRQHYAMQGKVKNYLGKQKMVKAPKKWKSAPNHPETELAYITKAEKDLILKADLHDSLSKGPNRGPSGIISLNSAGSGYEGGRSEDRNGSHDRGGRQHQQAAQTAAQKNAPDSPEGPPGGGDKGMTYTAQPSTADHHPDPPPVTTAKAPPSILARDKIDTGPKRDMHDFEIKKRKIIDITGGNPFLEDPYEKKIVYEPSDLPKRAYDPRTDPNALLQRPSGVLGTLGKIGLPALTAGAGAGLFGKDIATLAKAAKWAKRGKKIKTALDTGKLNILGKEFNLNNINKDILKQVSKDDIPKVADRHPGTGKKKRTTPPDDRDGINRILPETLQSAVSEGTQQYLSDEMKQQYAVAQNKMKAVLASGYYTDQDGRQIQLSDEQVNALTQWVSKIDGMLVDPVMMADGGRVDKALGGRVRDI